MKTFELPIYGDSVKIWTGEDQWNGYRDAARGDGAEIEEHCPVAECGETWDNLVWLRKFGRTPTLVGVLCHELCHLMCWFSEFHGIKDEEALAHLYGYLVQTILSEGVK
jgi:hypothetical protein